MNSVFERQILDNQLIILEELCSTVAKKDCMFLEIGSWLGDSTIPLAKIAKANNGKLFCIDWWKGNPATKLNNLAENYDVFSIFWNRIIANNLQDTVIPLRGNSKVIHKILKKSSFDFLFIDGDHSYDGITQDINNYIPLLKTHGIICGHDCEGYIDNFDSHILQKGKSLDYYQTIHCGVVLAVGEYFDNYAITQSIWSAKKVSKNEWKSPMLNNDNSPSQAFFPPLGYSESYFIYRAGKKLYARPKNIDFSLPTTKKDDPLSDFSLQSLSKKISEEIYFTDFSKCETNECEIILMMKFVDYNIVFFNQSYYAISLSLGELHLPALLEDKDKKSKLEGKNKLIQNSSFIELLGAVSTIQSKKFNK